MKLRSRRYRLKDSDASYWPSFVDIMTAAVLIFFFIMLISMAISSQFVDNISEKREKIYNSIQNNLDKNNVDKNIMHFDRNEGKMVISTETFFDTDKWILKKDGNDLAKKLNNIFLSLLNEEEIRDEIEYIEIVGHTDYAGDTISNRKLSTERAMSFLNAMMPMDSELENNYGGKFKASGMSEFETNKNKEDRDRKEYTKTDMEKTKDQRKIEIKMTFSNKDLEEAIKSKIKK